MTTPHRHALPVSLALLAALAMSAGGGCAGTPKAVPDDQKAAALSSTDEQIFIGDSIEKNYDPNVIIKRAESFFEKEEYAEAIIEYQHFMDLHKVHPLAPYAQYRLGESHYKMIKTIDRDSSPVKMAQAAYTKLLTDFPGSQWETAAREMIRSCHSFMALNEMFIGKFYVRREAYLASAHRFEAIIKEYPELDDIVQESLYYLALSYSGRAEIVDAVRMAAQDLRRHHSRPQDTDETSRVVTLLVPAAHDQLFVWVIADRQAEAERCHQGLSILRRQQGVARRVVPLPAGSVRIGRLYVTIDFAFG